MNEQGVVDFLMKLAGDAAAAAGGLSVAIGDRLGLYPAMAGAGPLYKFYYSSETQKGPLSAGKGP